MQIATSKAFTKYYYKYIYRPVVNDTGPNLARLDHPELGG